jgi:hypothetical protein
MDSSLPIVAASTRGGATSASNRPLPLPTSSMSNKRHNSAAPGIQRHVVSAPRYGAGRVTPDLDRVFVSCEQKSFKPTMYLDNGRTVQLNINRLPTPQVRKDYRTSILLGGCASYTEMVEQRQQQRLQQSLAAAGSASSLRSTTNKGNSLMPPRAASTPPIDLDLRRKLDEQQRHSQEFDIAVRREELLERQRAAQERLRHPTTTQNVSATGAFLQPNGDIVTPENILDVVDAPPKLPPPRVPTPAERTRKTLRTFEERAKTPDTRFETVYRPPTNFTLFHERSKRREEYESMDVNLLPPRGSTPAATMTTSPARQEGEHTRASADVLNTSPHAAKREVRDFEYRRAITEAEEAEYCDEVRAIIHSAQIPPPPKLILMLFRFGNVRNLPITDKLRTVGYPVIHEQFSSAADRGCITRQSFLNVMRRYADPKEMGDTMKLLNCFDKSSTGDVEINHFLLGMQILLKCASAGDTLKYCFSLMDTHSRVPRYVTRFEIQSLLASALTVRREKQSEMQRLGLQAQVEDEEGDKEFDIMARAIHELMDESWRYDYMGRIGLKEFLVLLRDKVHEWKDAVWEQQKPGRFSPRGQKPAVLFDSMGLDQGWQQQPCLAAAHRMSSKKMLYSSLQFVPSNALKDPHRIPAPTVVDQHTSFRSSTGVSSPLLRKSQQSFRK